MLIKETTVNSRMLSVTGSRVLVIYRMAAETMDRPVRQRFMRVHPGRIRVKTVLMFKQAPGTLIYSASCSRGSGSTQLNFFSSVDE